MSAASTRSERRRADHRPWCPAEYARSSEASSSFSRAMGAGTTAGTPPALTSERIRAALAGADPDDLLGLRDPDLAVADLAGAGGLLDGVDHALRLVLGHQHLDLHLGHEVDLVLGT